MRIATRRLALRDITRADRGAMVELWSDADVVRYMGALSDIERAAADPRRTSLAIELLVSRAFIGWLWFGPCTRGVADFDIGYALAPAYRGRGYATEALIGALDHCLHHERVDSVWGECFPENGVSEQVMKRAGMRFVGMAEGQLRFIALAGEWLPTR